MKFLFFDTETTGLPKDYNAPVQALDNWPRIVQLAWLVADGEGNTLDKRSLLVRPEGFQVPAGMVHGISHQRAMEEGKPLKQVMNAFWDALMDADYIVAHNYDFDAPVCAAEFIRSLEDDMISFRPAFCTQKQATEWAQIPAKGRRGHGRYKWPSLAGLHRRCGFGEIENAHDALADVEATARCFFHIRQHSPAVFYAPYKKTGARGEG